MDSLSLIHLSIRLVLEAGASMRCAAAMLELVAQHFHLCSPMPSASSIRVWIERLGCYRLQQPLEQRSDWVWLIDHTMQLGSLKLFVVVGCPLDRVPFGQRSLALSDLDLIALVPMDGSSQEKVDAVLEEATHRTGVPRQIVSDDASDLQKGVARFQERHPETIRLHDVAHHVANTLKHFWDGDPRWHALVQQMQATSDRLRQSDHAYLLAPKLRRKARFMSVDRFVRFASWLQGKLQEATPPEAIEREYGWLRGFASELPHWREQLRVSQAVLRRVRVDGLHCWSLDEIQTDWAAVLPHATTELLLGRLRGYVQRYAARLRGSETLVGSTEILESAFGKQKRIVSDQSESGLTGLSLALGPMLGGLSDETIRAGLEAVPEKASTGWIHRTFGRTVQWFRRQLLGEKNPPGERETPTTQPVPKTG